MNKISKFENKMKKKLGEQTEEKIRRANWEIERNFEKNNGKNNEI